MAIAKAAKKGSVKVAARKAPLRHYKRVVELSTGKVKLSISPLQANVLALGRGSLETLPVVAGKQWKNVLEGLREKGLVVANSKGWRLTLDGRKALKAIERNE